MYEKNQKIGTFTVTRVRESDEINGTLTELVHDGTGARVLWVNNGLSNKLFSISFLTPPEDSTGVPHILEHSTLCGSAKYPVREPFVELLKSSMNTFLNAFTANEMTMYPVSSRNETDFLNLTEVYLDAVFAPRLLEDPNIFRQEGWHVENNGGTLSYKGVVFNEMKGAMSDVDDLISQELMNLLFPDTCYRHNSGGEPANIPDLSWEQFKAVYRRFYHPSNAVVFLDGSVPLEKVLVLLEEYFGRYEKREDLPELVLQTPKASEKTVPYELDASESPENHGHLAMGRIFGSATDLEKTFAARVVLSAVLGSNETPIKRAVLDAGLAENIEADLADSFLQSCFTLVARNVKDGCEAELMRLVEETAAALAEEGLDREELTAAINRMEFQAKEPQEPAGLIHCITSVSNLLYGGDPLEPLLSRDRIARLRGLLDTGYYEDLLREMFLSREGRVVLHLTPSLTLGEEKRRAEAERLAALKASWTEKELEENRLENESLTAWQQTEETPEQLASIPQLSLSQVDEEPEYVETEEKEEDGVRILYHPAACPGIVCFSLYFTLADHSLEDLTRLTTLAQFFGKLPTRRHSARELKKLTDLYTGGLSFHVRPLRLKGRDDVCRPALIVSCKALCEHAEKAQELVAEILTETCFEDKGRIREMILQRAIMAKEAPVSSGHSIAMLAVHARCGAADAVNEALSGQTALNWVQRFSSRFEEEADGFLALLEKACAETVCKKRLILSETAQSFASLRTLLTLLPEGTEAPWEAGYSLELPEKTCLKVPSQSGFAAKGLQERETEACPQGAAEVAAQILSLNYLWNRVRVQGGAYGCGLNVGREGTLTAYSFRDPTPAASLRVFDGCGDYLRRFCEENETFEKYIISTVAGTEPLATPLSLGEQATQLALSGVTREDLRNRRRGMLRATKEQLLAFAGTLDRFAREGAESVVAHEEALKECEGFAPMKKVE